jgi:hypothetical protein
MTDLVARSARPAAVSAGPAAVDVTVVLPCAGQGSRFGGPYPKELHCVRPGVSVVDLALAPVIDVARLSSVRVAVALSPEKLSVARHLARYRDDVELFFGFQRDGGGVRAALDTVLPVCQGPVVLLLADQFFDWTSEHNPVRDCLDLLPSAGWSVLAARCDQPDVLRIEGALRVVDTEAGRRVAAAAEKPVRTEEFNAMWAGIACAPEALPQLGDIFDPAAESPLVGAPAEFVAGYHNVTTAESV